MKYEVKQLVKKMTGNFEGVIIQDEQGQEFISNGVYMWDANKDRMNQCVKVNSIDKNALIDKWYRFMGYSKLVFNN
jgi:hypothetical protein